MVKWVNTEPTFQHSLIVRFLEKLPFQEWSLMFGYYTHIAPIMTQVFKAPQVPPVLSAIIKLGNAYTYQEDRQKYEHYVR